MALHSYLTARNRTKVQRNVNMVDLLSKMKIEKAKETKNNITLLAGTASVLAVSALLIIL